MKEEISKLYQDLIEKTHYQKGIDEFINYSNHFRKIGDINIYLNLLWDIENKIGGIGIHNINIIESESEDIRGQITGTYCTGDRAIFRPIQYCSRAIHWNVNNHDTRYFLNQSCLHIESIWSEIFSLLRSNWKRDFTLGQTLYHKTIECEFINDDEKHLLLISRFINKVYRSSKHDLGNLFSDESQNLGIDEHMYSTEEALIVYFSCRLIGIRLMNWLSMNDNPVESLYHLPIIKKKEFMRIALCLGNSIL